MSTAMGSRRVLSPLSSVAVFIMGIKRSSAGQLCMSLCRADKQVVNAINRALALALATESYFWGKLGLCTG